MTEMTPPQGPPPQGPPPQGPPPQAGPPQQPAAPTTYTCPWCRVTSANVRMSCPACGAPVDARQLVSDSGWTELPPIRDMAHIQFGQSHCQVSGTLVPVADFNLAQEDGVFFAHHMMLWKDVATPMTAMKMKGGFQRMLAGMPIVMTQATGPGHIAFSRDVPGEMVALPLQQGMAVEVREHHFVVGTHTISYDWIQSGIWFTTDGGNDQETHYPLGRYLDVFYAQQQPGLVLLHAGGNAFVRTLRPGEAILVQPASLLFKDTTVSMWLHIEQPYNNSGWMPWRAWSNRHLWLRLTGPGRVCVQSAYEMVEERPGSLYNSSGHTMRVW